MELKYKYNKIKHIRHNIKLIHIYIHINHVVMVGSVVSCSAGPSTWTAWSPRGSARLYRSPSTSPSVASRAETCRESWYVATNRFISCAPRVGTQCYWPLWGPTRQLVPVPPHVGTQWYWPLGGPTRRLVPVPPHVGTQWYWPLGGPTRRLVPVPPHVGTQCYWSLGGHSFGHSFVL